jgi:hypothetical protein
MPTIEHPDSASGSTPDSVMRPPVVPVDPRFVAKVISVRGPLLTLRRKNVLWVIRAGADPRAWKKRVNRRGNGIGPWQQARPPLDELIRCPGAFPPSAAAVIHEFRFRKRYFHNQTWSDVFLTPGEDDSGPDAATEAATSPFPWACRPGEAERLRCWSRLEPDDYLLDFNGRIAYRDMDRLPLGMSCHKPVPVPFSASDEGHRLLRVTIRQVRLLRKQLPAWAAFFPEGAMDFLERHRFTTRRWHLLNLWLRVPDGRELWDEIPALAWLAASSWLCRRTPVQRPLRSLRALVRKPRSHLLRWLGLPPGKGTLSLLRSLDPSLMTTRFKHLVLDVLRCEEKRRAWQNLPKPVGYRELSLLAYDEPISFPILRLINEEAEVDGPGGRRESVDYLFAECVRMIENLESGFRHDPILARIRSAERLLAFHDELVDLTNELRWDLGEADWWPCHPIKAPFAPAPWMTPLATREELVNEGLLMRHCVAGYGLEVVGGNFYVYALNHPEHGRATLGLRKIGGGAWEIAEIRGKSNQTVSDALRNLVEEWFAEKVSEWYARHASARLAFVDSWPMETARTGTEEEDDLDDLIPF